MDFTGIYRRNCDQLQIVPNKAVLVLIEESVKKGHKISSLDLSYKKMESRDVLPLAATFGYNFPISQLNLSHNLIEKRGCKAIANMLVTNTTLTSLNLASNMIGDSGTTYLCQSLRTNTSLKVLILKDNNIKDEGLKAIATMLTQNEGLTEMNLEGNHFSHAGLEALAKVLQQGSCHLEVLRLGANSAATLPQHLVADLPPHFQKSFTARVGGTEQDEDPEDLKIKEHLREIATSVNSEMALLQKSGDDDIGHISRRFAELSSSVTSKMKSLQGSESPKVSLISRTSSPAAQQKNESAETLKRKIRTLEKELEQLRAAHLANSSETQKLEDKLKHIVAVHRKELDVLNLAAIKNDNMHRATIQALQDRVDMLQHELIEKSKKVIEVEHNLDRLKYEKEKSVKDLKYVSEKKLLQSQERWQNAHDQVTKDFSEHEKKHKEEFFALYNDYEETKKQVVTLKEQTKRMKYLEEENTKLREEVEQLQAIIYKNHLNETTSDVV